MYDDFVEEGAKLLDEARPGWEAEIACDKIAMETCDQCILGQLYGDYECGIQEVIVYRPRPRRRCHSSTFGFTLPTAHQDPDAEMTEVILERFRVLAEAWRAEIKRRLLAGV